MGEPITIYGKGSQTRSFCYVDDLIEAILRFMQTDDEVTGPVNLGNPAEFSIFELAQKIIELVESKSQIQFEPLPQDDPYLQYFVGLPGYQMQVPFVPSLFVEIRKCMGQEVFEVFHGAIVDAMERERVKSKASRSDDPDDQGPPAPRTETSDPEKKPTHQGMLILDATVAEQAIRYPTDLSMLNEAREFGEQIIDLLYAQSAFQIPPPTTDSTAVKSVHPGHLMQRIATQQQNQYRLLGRPEIPTSWRYTSGKP